MAIDQLDFVLQFCIRLAAVYVITAMAVKTARRLSKPVGTYGAGLPERRMRPRLVLNVPAVRVTQPADQTITGAAA
jgi:hypothetical protein